MNYLNPSEYETYGLDATTPEVWIASASALIDSHCRRPTLAINSYTERLRIPEGRNTVRLCYLPLAPLAPATSPLVSARGRYGLPRRGELADPFTIDIALAFALPGTWTTLDVTSFDYLPDIGEITLPRNPLGLAYNEIEISYTAGLATIPGAVKFACAQLVRNAQATPALNVRSGRVDRMRLEYFADVLLDVTICSQLAPYVSNKLG